MFDFLSEEKRRVLINHPSLGKILTSSRTIDQFCANLHAFEQDLCNPGREEIIRFTEEEIERIKKYARSVFSDELKELAQRIFQEAGFEVFWWSGALTAGELINDWVHPSARDPWYSYRRAYYKLHGFYPAREDPMSTGIPYNLIFTDIPQEVFRISPDIPHGCGLKEINDFKQSFSKEPIEHIGMRFGKLHPNYIACWMLCSEITYEEPKKHPVVREKEVPRRFIGSLGFKKKVEYKEWENVPSSAIKSAKFMKLNTIVETNDSSPAYLIRFLLQKVIERRREARPGGYAQIYVLGSKKLTQDTISFLLKNTDLYCDLIRGFIPKSVFPNVNQGILEAPSLPAKGLVFENYTSGERIIVP